jgi:hypothetical protein
MVLVRSRIYIFQRKSVMSFPSGLLHQSPILICRQGSLIIFHWRRGSMLMLLGSGWSLSVMMVAEPFFLSFLFFFWLHRRFLRFLYQYYVLFLDPYPFSLFKHDFNGTLHYPRLVLKLLLRWRPRLSVECITVIDHFLYPLTHHGKRACEILRQKLFHCHLHRVLQSFLLFKEVFPRCHELLCVLRLKRLQKVVI